MTIPTSVTFSKNGTRITGRCTDVEGAQISLSVNTKTGIYTCQHLNEGCDTPEPVRFGLLSMVEKWLDHLNAIGKDYITRDQRLGLLKAVHDTGIRSEPGMVHGEIKIVEGSPLVIYRGYDDPYDP